MRAAPAGASSATQSRGRRAVAARRACAAPPPGSASRSPAAPPRERRPPPRAQLDEPRWSASGQRRGDVERRAGRRRRGARGEGRGHGRRRVDDEEVARREHVRQVAEARVARRAPDARSATSSRTSSRASPRASGGSCASSRSGRSNVERAHARHAGASIARLVAAARLVALDQGARTRARFLGRRPVGDVLAGERLLVHLRAHVAGVDGVDAQLRAARRRGPRVELLERGLRRAVAAPALVGLDGGVGGDVDDRRARAAAAAARAATSASGAMTLTS